MKDGSKRMMHKITMSDVARQSGVDLSTVSRVLNRSFKNHKYAPETVRRVQDAAKDLGYQPSLAARSLRTGKTMLLGVVVSDISNSFFGELAAALDASISGHGYRLLISNTNENPSRQAEHIDGMLAHGVDGLIVSPSGTNGLDKAMRAGVPIVTVDRPLPEGGFPFVGLDNKMAARLLSTELKARGYNQIGIVVPENQSDITLQERLTGLQDGLKAAGCEVAWVEQLSSSDELREKARQAVIKQLESDKTPPDVLLGLSNVCTMGIIEALEDLEMSWGETLGVTGIDDFDAASLVRPAITVVRQPVEQIAAEAFSLLLKKIENPKEDHSNQTIRIKPIWVERESLPDRDQESGDRNQESETSTLKI